MRKFGRIAVFIVIICMLASCASSRKGQVPCPAYGSKSSGYERMPY